MGLLLAILLSVTLQPPFIEAEAQVLDTTGAFVIDLSVQVEGEPTAVLARMVGLAGELPTLALVERSEGVWGNVVRLTGEEDITVAFEYIEEDGTTAISSGSRLTALGIDPAVFAADVPVAPEPQEGFAIDPWLILGVAAALSTVVLLMWWANGGFSGVVKASDWTYAEAAGIEDDPDRADGEAEEEEPATAD